MAFLWGPGWADPEGLRLGIGPLAAAGIVAAGGLVSSLLASRKSSSEKLAERLQAQVAKQQADILEQQGRIGSRLEGLAGRPSAARSILDAGGFRLPGIEGGGSDLAELLSGVDFDSLRTAGALERTLSGLTGAGTGSVDRLADIAAQRRRDRISGAGSIGSALVSGLFNNRLPSTNIDSTTGIAFPIRTG
ncbi:MAG: hypothetical protein ACE5NA_00065 [Nitrospiraceae bacterium]